jgi:hypothetical protein
MGKPRTSRGCDTSVNQAAGDQIVNAIQALAIALRQHTWPGQTGEARRRVREELATAKRAVEQAIVYTKGP